MRFNLMFEYVFFFAVFLVLKVVFLYFLLLGKVSSHGWSLSPSFWAWGSSPKLNGFGRLAEEKPPVSFGNFGANGVRSGGHCSTVERLYAWEKKLYQEVKVCIFFLSFF